MWQKDSPDWGSKARISCFTCPPLKQKDVIGERLSLMRLIASRSQRWTGRYSCLLLVAHPLITRPIAGHANLCPDSISTKPQDQETLLSTVKHEILHALGFSVSLYAYFRDKDGRPLTPRGRNGKPRLKDSSGSLYWGDNVIKRFIRHDWKVRGASVKKEVHVIVTPRVVVSNLRTSFFPNA